MNLVLDSLTLDDLLHDQKRYIYLDHSATTAVDEEVLSKMLPYFYEKAGNASSQHGMGRDAEVAVDRARKQVADAIGAKSNEIYFTSGGSESDNWALKGIAHAYKSKGKHLITSEFEHPAVLNTMKQLEAEGFEVSYLHTNPQGYVSADELESIIRPDTILVSVMYANNEIGTIQPIEELAKVAHAHGAFFHTDAVQAAGLIPIRMREWDVDALSLSGHKFGTPKGLGALLLRSRVPVEPLMSGGGQERSLRSGTQNVAGAVALAVALRDSNTRMHEIGRALVASRDRLIDAVLRVEPRAQLTGDSQRRLPGHASFVFPGLSGEALLVDLDARGIACSSGSACAVGRHEAPGTLLAMGYDPAVAKSAIRMTFREPLTLEQINQIASVVEESCNSLRGASTVSDPSINVQAQQALA